MFNDKGVPCGPIYRIDQTFADPQVQHLNVTDKVTSKTLGEMEFVKQPIILERTPSSFAVAPPECGEHTDEVLADLGFSIDEIAALRAGNVV